VTWWSNNNVGKTAVVSEFYCIWQNATDNVNSVKLKLCHVFRCELIGLSVIMCLRLSLHRGQNVVVCLMLQIMLWYCQMSSWITQETNQFFHLHWKLMSCVIRYLLYSLLKILCLLCLLTGRYQFQLVPLAIYLFWLTLLNIGSLYLSLKPKFQTLVWNQSLIKNAKLNLDPKVWF